MSPWEWIVVALAVAIAVALPLVTLWRLRTPERRRDEWLGAAAQPRLTRLSFALSFALTAVGGLVSVFIAVDGFPLAWATVALSAGLLASTLISAVVALRTPR